MIGKLLERYDNIGANRVSHPLELMQTPLDIC
jgi:hypothetical protein